MIEDLRACSSPTCHHVSAALTQPQTVIETASLKNKHRALPGYAEARTLQDIPSERSSDRQFEFPSANLTAALAFD